MLLRDAGLLNDENQVKLMLDKHVTYISRYIRQLNEQFVSLDAR